MVRPFGYENGGIPGPLPPLPEEVHVRKAGEPVIRYRIELYTDKHLRWFAQIETFDDSPSPRVQWTKTAETWVDAVKMAEQRIAADRH
jgi:hypothetical protein